MERYKTLSGKVVTYDKPDPVLAGFLARVLDATHDPTCSESELVMLIYGNDNPLLEQSIFDDRGVVTHETIQNPIYLVMLDLLEQKRIQVGTINPRKSLRATAPPPLPGPLPKPEPAPASTPVLEIEIEPEPESAPEPELERARPGHTMSVQDAAAMLSVTTGSVLRMYKYDRLVGSGEGANLRFDPTSVKEMLDEADGVNTHNTRKVALHGELDANASLYLLEGERGELAFRVKHDGTLKDASKIGNNRAGRIDAWQNVGALMRDGETCRFCVLRPAATRDVLSLKGFFLRGAFEIVQVVDGEDLAEASFEAFEPGA